MSPEGAADDDQPEARHPLAAGLGAALQAVDVLAELIAEATQTVVTKVRTVTASADRRYHDAADRGDLVIRKVATDARHSVGNVADITVGWVDRAVVQRMVESMKPYLIESLVPEVIDGVLPKIREDVIPVVMADLADDDQVQAMVAAQSKDAVDRGLTEVRRATAEADDRVEESVRKVFGRRGPDE